jgi:TIR domain
VSPVQTVRDRIGARAGAPLPGSAPEGPRPRRRGDASAERVFISYRRADSGGWARSLHDHLDERLGRGHAFRDVAMEGGMDFHEHVETLLDRCDVLLAIIGKQWSSIRDADGKRRLNDPEDLVRREIARALQRPDVEVIPVLVDGARMPTEHELPPDLAPLSRRQACELADSRWDYDVELLTERVRVLLGAKRPRARPGTRLTGAGALIAVVGVLFMLWPSLMPEGAPATKAAKLSNPTLDRDISFGQYLDRKALPRRPYPSAQLAQRGAFVAFDFRVEGYRGKRLPLRWQLVDARTGDQISQSRAFAITPDATTDQGSWDVWVPVPRERRRVYVQVQLYDDDGIVPVGRMRTATFSTREAEPAR